MLRRRPSSGTPTPDAPVLADLRIPADGILRLPEGAVSCTFQAADSDTRGLLVRLPNGRGAAFCHVPWGGPGNGLIDEHGVLHQHFYADEADLFEEIPAPEGDTPAARSAALAEIFWSDLNPSLDDPYLADGALENQELDFRNGDLDAFEQVIRWAAACTPPERIQEPLELVFYAEGADEGAEMDRDQLPDGLDLLETVANLALEHFGPMGESWDYNDGAYGRQSGYSNYRASFCVTVEPPSAHARIEARAALSAWLRDTARMEPEEIARLLGI